MEWEQCDFGMSNRQESGEEDLEKAILKVNEVRTLYNLHHDIWDETLLEPPFIWYYRRVLHPRERQVIDGRILGKTVKEIASEMGLNEKSVMRYIYNIRYVFRNKTRGRVNEFWKICSPRKLRRRNRNG